ncbi:MAG: hypothetical protein MK102_11360 [Fuerstiella sp.]|nr:hypothetical protein [Fuerstiella sp.]
MTFHRRSFESVRTGFTLLELTLAIGLTSLLMAAVYGAMSTCWSLAMDSHEEIMRAQVARSLLQQLARDIQSCTFVEQVNQTQAEETNVENTVTEKAGTGVCHNGLVGTDRDLVLYISYPSRNLGYVAAPDAVGTTDRHSDLMVVRWLLAESSGGGLSSAMAGQQTTVHDGPVAGLARGNGGVTGFGQAIETGDINLQVDSTVLLSHEVKGIRFEYFDGLEWLTEWNSASLNKIPLAVRIELTLRGSSPTGDAGSLGSGAPNLTTHTLVVPIPVASPFIEGTAL